MPSPLAQTPGYSPTWLKRTITFTQLQTAALTNSVVLMTLPAGYAIHYAEMNVTANFSGTATLTLALGTAGSNGKYVAAVDVKAGSQKQGVSLVPTIESYSATTTISVFAVATTNNLSSLTVGSVDIYFLVSALP